MGTPVTLFHWINLKLEPLLNIVGAFVYVFQVIYVQMLSEMMCGGFGVSLNDWSST